MADVGWEDRVRARAYALWEREGQPEGGAERHWVQAEEELRTEEHGRAEAPAAEATRSAASTAGTETWTEQGEPTAEEEPRPEEGASADPSEPGAEGEGRNWWQKDATEHRSGYEQINQAPDNLESNEL